MRRQVCWVERLEDGLKRETRVTFLSGDRIKWQFQVSDSSLWDYNTPPTAADWEALEERVENRYRRRSATLADLELVRRGRQQAVGRQAADAGVETP